MHNGTVESGVFVNEHREGYLEGLRTRGYSPKSIGIYARAIQVFEMFLASKGVHDLQSVDKGFLIRYRLHLGEKDYQPASIEIFLRGLKGFFTYLEDGQYLFLNPAEDLVVKQAERKLLPVPSEEDVQRLLAQPDTHRDTGLRDRALLETAYGTGARLGELSGLLTTSLNLEEGTVRLLGKGRRERVVPMGQAAAQWTGRYLEEARPKLLKALPSEALWISRRCNALGYQCMGVMMRRYGIRAGIRIPITPHSLRRACATHMLRHGAAPISIQHLLGHSSLKHLSQYLRVSLTEIQSMHQRSKPGQ